MKLYEFFNVPVDKTEKDNPHHVGLSTEEKEKIADELFWYIVDHDNLHKEFVLPFVRDIRDQVTSPEFNLDRFKKSWAPMVAKGCKLFYKEKKLKKDPKDLFPEDIKQSICDRLAEKYIEEIKNKSYHIGSHKL